jgi:cytochrome P450
MPLPPLVTFPESIWRDTVGIPSYLAGLAERHGPIVRREIDGGPNKGVQAIYMVGPEANRFVLHTHRHHFSHDQGWTPVIGETLGRGLLNMDPPEWNQHRQMMNPAFTAAYMAAYLPLMSRVVAERTRDWPERGRIDLFHEARDITFDVAAAALVGFERGARVDELRELFYALFHSRDVERESWEEFQVRRRAIRDKLVGTLLRLIHERRAAGPKEHDDVLGMMVAARDEDGKALSDAQLLAHVNILLVAGHETTTTLGAWVLYLLARHRAYLARVEAELAELPPGPPEFDKLRRLEVLGNAITEAGRLHSPVVTVPRGIVDGFEFAGCQVPAGLQCRLAISAGHRLPGVFSNPDVFDPDRFAPPRQEDKRPYALVTFGGGPRVCIGINFAQIEVRALCCHVLRSYRIEPIGDADPEPIGWIASFLPNGIPVRVTQCTV